MTAPDAQQHGYGQTAAAYRKAGWQGVLPLDRGKKWPPPEGYTGHTGVFPTGGDIMQWTRERPDGGLALRMPRGIIGVDVDVYGSKRGDLALAELEDRYGALPPTWSSTSRGPGLSRISLYRCAEDLTLPGKLGDSIEAIQYHHRYAVVWPSVVDGRRYRWYTPDGMVVDRPPRPSELAWLPDGWHAIQRAPRPTIEGTARPVVLNAGEWSRATSRYHAEGVAWLKTSGSRHDDMLPVIMSLARLDHDGHPGAGEALDDLAGRFVLAIQDRSSGPQAEAEWRRMVDGAEAEIAVTPSLRGSYEDLRSKVLGHEPPPRATFGDFADEPAGEQAEDETPFDGGEWGFVDLAPFLDGTYQRPQPTILELDQ